MIKTHVFALSLVLFTAGAVLTATASDVEAATKKYCHTHSKKSLKKKSYHCHYKKVVEKKTAKKTKAVKSKKTTVSKKYDVKKVKIVPASVSISDQKGTTISSGSKSKTIGIANNYVGLSERRNRKQLMGLFGFAFNHKVDPSRTPWCAAFANGVLKKSGKPTTGSLAANSFLSYGKKTRKPSHGDIVVLKPGRRYHVGFYMGTVVKNGVKYVKVLGGNQSNQVKVTYYKASKVVAYRTT